MRQHAPDLDHKSYTPDRPPPFDDWPAVYACRCFGDCCEPEIADGSSVVIDRHADHRAGDFVAIWYLGRSGFIEAMVKRLAVGLAPWTSFPHRARPGDTVRPALIVETLNPPRRFGLDVSTVYAVHRCIGTAPARPDVALGTMVPEATIQWFDRLNAPPRLRRGGKGGAHG